MLAEYQDVVLKIVAPEELPLFKKELKQAFVAGLQDSFPHSDK